jgi:DNA topoisomerase-1
MKKLLIVESPNKCKTIKKYLGDEWTVKASMGHISDLPKKELGIDKANGFKPIYQITEEKKNVVADLTKIIKEIGKDNVYLATDEDREGEAISYHLCKNLGLDFRTTKRVTFNEITETVIKNAVKKPRLLNITLVAAQEARRAIDRLVGYEISPVLWKKIESDTPLSAGRVQSVAVKLIVEREKHILEFKPVSSFKLSGTFKTPGCNNLKATATADISSSTIDLMREYLKSTDGKKFSITGITKTPNKTNPQPPFSTSTLQQDANKKLKLSVDQTMQIAQKLYENGHITYMRTDSVNLSDVAIESLGTFIVSTYGEQYLEKRKFKNKNENAQEAHEAIRPTHFDAVTIDGTAEEQELYKLIYLRSVASQMKAKETMVTTITINSTSNNDEFQAKASIVTFDGYTKAYSEITEEETEETDEVEIKESLNVGDQLQLIMVTAKTSLSKPKSRFGEADLVKELETLGIGRPSTYASIIKNIKDVRKYVSTGKATGTSYDTLTITYENGKITEQKGKVTLGQASGKLIPNAIAFKLVEFLQNEFTPIMDYKFTAKCEDNFDLIAEGKLGYTNVVSTFYTDLSKCLNVVDSKYENVAQRERKTFDLGIHEKHNISVGKGEYGVYIRYKEEFFNVKDIEDPQTITLEKAIQIINEKREADKKRKEEKKANTIKDFGKYKVIQGNFGPYVTNGTDNAPVPKFDLEKLDSYDAEKIKEVIKSHKAYKKKQAKK